MVAQDGVLLKVSGLRMHYRVLSGLLSSRTRGWVKAVDDVSFVVRKGETLGLVGESGSGKTTTGMCILQLQKPTAGQVVFDGKDLSSMREGELRATRRRIQVIFQDPFSSINPRMTAGDAIGEPLLLHKVVTGRKEYWERVGEIIREVGLSPAMLRHYPHQFSGGQRQRIVIARAMALRPDFIVADEPVSALDVSVQAQIINLMQELQDKFKLTYLFIAHDLSVVRHVSDRVAVMYLGRIVEMADRDEIYASPVHPYTQALLSAAPIPDPAIEAKRQRMILKGEIPSPMDPPPGCAFHPRCSMATEECRQLRPELREVSTGHWAACIKAPGYATGKLSTGEPG
jgi:oligopeptide transport system ATP-binding protein